MESNWRWNVAEQGFANGPFRLMARYVGDPNLWVAGFSFAPNGMIGLIGENPFTGEWSWQPFMNLIGDRFPFGWEVEPD